ncbi:MAG: Lrp/AsnC family transcriptional regulator [Candidatus Asgardarchaeia archaeon]
MENLSKLDRMIISSLVDKHNCVSYKEIAEELNVTRQTVAKRIKRLMSRGVIKGFRCSIDYTKIGYSITAIILADVKEFNERTIREIQNWIKDKEENVLYWGTITGRWSIFMMAIFRSVEDLENFLMSGRENGPFSRTETSIVMHLYKTIDDWHLHFKNNHSRMRMGET